MTDRLPSDATLAAAVDAPLAPSTRTFVRTLLVVIIVFGVAGFEAWPLTSFRLFSTSRGTVRTSYEAVTVDAAGRETPFEQSTLAFGYRLAEWPMSEIAGASEARQRALCEAIAVGARDAGREVVEVRVEKVRERLVRRGNDWEIVRAEPELVVGCPADERGGVGV